MSRKQISKKGPTEKVRKFFLTRPGKGYRFAAIAKKLKFKQNKTLLNDILQELVNEKFISYHSGIYRLGKPEAPKPELRSKIQGTVDKARSGARYVIVPDRSSDIYVHQKNAMNAQNGDFVEVEITRIRKNKNDEGIITKILEHGITQMVARIVTTKNKITAVPIQNNDYSEIEIDRKSLGKAKEGDVVLLKILSYPKKAHQVPIAEVLEVLNNMENHAITDFGILVEYGFDPMFPKHIDGELNEIVKMGVHGNMGERRDFREVLTCTIDPVDAKDFDDALSIETLEDGVIEVGIHIADVTHYLQPDTELDKLAAQRSTSVYLVGRTSPMLPEELSNDLCSLVEGEDRLTFSVVVRFDKDYNLIHTWMGKTIIHSDKRFAYEDAQEIIEGADSDWKEPIQTLNAIAYKLRQKKNDMGAINFDSDEFKFKLDEQKNPTEIYIKERKDAHVMIEDFMLLANRLVASVMGKKHQQRPFVYRIHDAPDISKLRDLSLVAKMLGFSFKIDNEDMIRKSFNLLHDEAQKDERLDILESMGIRSMAKAIYDVENIGHFGLAFPYYTHFTSPIRRYADVLVHRCLQAMLTKAKSPYALDRLSSSCAYISRRERMAMDAERKSIKLKQMEYIKRFEGQEMLGQITNFMERGMFIRLLDNGITGLLSFDNFDEPFDLHPTNTFAIGRKSRTKYMIGDKLDVFIKEVDLDNLLLDLGLAEENA